MVLGARSKFGRTSPCSELRSFVSKCALLKKVFVTLLGLFGAPIMIWRMANCAPLAPRRHPPEYLQLY